MDNIDGLAPGYYWVKVKHEGPTWFAGEFTGEQWLVPWIADHEPHHMYSSRGRPPSRWLAMERIEQLGPRILPPE